MIEKLLLASVLVFFNKIGIK